MLNVKEYGDLNVEDYETVESLKLNTSQITIKQCEKLKNALQQCSKLTTLFIWMISPEAQPQRKIVTILRSLKDCKTLQEISVYLVSKDIFGAEGMEALSDGLTNCINLKKMNLSFRQVKVKNEGFNMFSQKLVQWKNLQELYLQVETGEIGVEGINNLGRGLVECESLKKINLDLSNNHDIGSLGVISLSNQLQNAKNLQDLSLSLNGIELDGEAFQVIGNCLKNLKELQSLRLLFWNSVMKKTENLSTMIKSFSECPKLESLSMDLMWGFIGDSGLALVGEGLIKCLTLKTIDLNLRDNRITRQGMEAFLGHLVNCKELETLYLNIEENDIGDQGQELLGFALSQCKKLSTLRLSASQTLKGNLDFCKQIVRSDSLAVLILIVAWLEGFGDKTSLQKILLKTKGLVKLQCYA